MLPNPTNYDLVDNLFGGGGELEKPEIIELLEESEGDANNATFIQSTKIHLGFGKGIMNRNNVKMT